MTAADHANWVFAAIRGESNLEVKKGEGSTNASFWRRS